MSIRTIKILLIGNTGVGKTSTLNKYLNNQSCTESEFSTINVNEDNSKIFIHNGIDWELLFFDTGGQEKFEFVRLLYYKNADIVIFVVDITSDNYIYYYEKFMKELIKNIENVCDYKIIIVITKSDIIEKNEIYFSILKNFKDSLYNDIKPLGYEYCILSNKTGYGFEEFNDKFDNIIINRIENKNKLLNIATENLNIKINKFNKNNSCC